MLLADLDWNAMTWPAAVAIVGIALSCAAGTWAICWLIVKAKQ